MAARKKATRRKKAAPASRGLEAQEVGLGEPPPEIGELDAAIRESGGVALTAYRDPLGGGWLTLASLPLTAIAPTPFQRDLSDAHVKRLSAAIDKVGTFLDPVVAVPVPEASREDGGDVRFWTPNGLHRLNALALLGAKSVTALISADPALAYRILALNTEKAHTTKERALEAVRMARGLADLEPTQPEANYAFELEDGSLVTLGLCYEERARFAGGAYAPALKASDAFLDDPTARRPRAPRGARQAAARHRRPRGRDHQGPEGEGVRQSLPAQLRGGAHPALPPPRPGGARCGRAPRPHGEGRRRSSRQARSRPTRWPRRRAPRSRRSP